MINIAKNYRFLFNFTTITFSFLSTVSVNANSDNRRASCDVTGSSYIMCNDGKTHTIKNKTYNLTDSQKDSSGSVPVAVIHVEKKGTIIDASKIEISGGDSNTISIYGGYVKDNGKFILKESNFKGVLGLRAEKGTISMTDGAIKGSPQAIYASGKETDVALVRIGIEIDPSGLNTQTSGLKTQNNLNVNAGIVSESGAMVRMSGGSVTFNEKGSFLSRLGGKYLLSNLTIEGTGKKENATVNDTNTSTLSEAFEVLQGGNVHLKASSLQLTDMNGFLVENFSVFLNSKGQFIQDYITSDTLKKTNIKIENSTISVKGKGEYGLYFNLLDSNKVAKFYGKEETVSKTPHITMGEAFVHLSNTTLAVPDGTAIYATGADGYGVEASIELSENTKVSGGLLLKAENNSVVSIKAQDSSLRGGIHVGKAASVVLQLNHGSTWFIEKRRQKDLQESNSVDFSVSRLQLSDSSLVFSQNGSSGYQTLCIESERYQEVYIAKGNVQITLGAFLNENGLFEPNKNDRILINGDVSGTTLVNMNDFFRNSEKKVSSGKVSNGSTESISLIQVSGKANEDSFKLISNYTTVSGFPYQYHLRGYGQNSSFGKADSKNRLVKGRRDFWDFRLEAVYIQPPSNPSENVSVLPASPSSDKSPPVVSPSTDSTPALPIDSSSVPSIPVAPPTPDFSASDGAPTEDHSPSVSSDLAESLPAGSTPVLPIPLMPPSLPSDETSDQSSDETSDQSSSVRPAPIDSMSVPPTDSPSELSVPSIPVTPPTPDSSASDGASTKDHSPSVSSDLAESLPAGSTPVLPIPLMPPSLPSDETSDQSSDETSDQSSSVRPAPIDSMSVPPTDSPSELSVPSIPVTPPTPDSSASDGASTTDFPSASSDPIEVSSTDISTPSLSTDSILAPVSAKSDIRTKQGIRAVVPQLPTYMLLPNALF
ncbi:hypothetical protein ABID39_001226, partial [Bartonella japonica]